MEGVTFLIQPLEPKSSGTLKIRSTNPFDPPDVDPEYLEHHDDVASLIQGGLCSETRTLLFFKKDVYE